MPKQACDAGEFGSTVLVAGEAYKVEAAVHEDYGVFKCDDVAGKLVITDYIGQSSSPCHPSVAPSCSIALAQGKGTHHFVASGPNVHPPYTKFLSMTARPPTSTPTYTPMCTSYRSSAATPSANKSVKCCWACGGEGAGGCQSATHTPRDLVI